MTAAGQRQNPLVSVPPEEFEAAFEAIQKHFSWSWLTATDGAHRIQRLWRRRDAISTIELYSLGAAIVHMTQIDERWVRHQIGALKTNDKNNQKGAAFELLAAYYLTAPPQIVRPASPNARGYDLDVQSGDDCWRVSLKAYSTSVHERVFRKRMDTVRALLEQTKQRRPPSHWLVRAIRSPGEGDWAKLYLEVQRLLSAAHSRANIAFDCWQLTVSDLLPADNEVFDSRRSSFTLIGIAPRHPNEQHNFLSKLELAVGNLNKHVRTQKSLHPMILLRLPPTADAKQLRQWVEDYLVASPQGSLESVCFLQPFIASDPTGRTSFVAHYYLGTSSKRAPLLLEIPVGKPVTAGPVWELGTDGEKLLGHYVFQAGRHFVSFVPTSTGERVTLARKAPGIYTQTILGDHVIAGRWAEELLLLGE